MFGKTGLGKTHLSLAIANEVLFPTYALKTLHNPCAVLIKSWERISYED